MDAPDKSLDDALSPAGTPSGADANGTEKVASGRGTLSRRALFGAAGVAAGAAVVAGTASAGYSAGRSAAPLPGDVSYDFFGAHQAGIVTPAQDRLHFASFDLTTESRDRLIALLRRWSTAAAALTRGAEIGTGATDGPSLLPPDDTGEALGLPASGLTITFGFGRGMFVKDGKPRFGLEGKLPEQLIELPHFAGDAIVDAISGGDLCIQACAHDPQVAVHAIRNLARLAIGDASVRWAQLGFGRTASTSRSQTTPRNLMGFKDGTHNLLAEDTDLIKRWLWAQAGDGQEWMAGGTYLVTRKIRILIENWDRASLAEQEASVGRDKSKGAPLSGGSEFTAPDFQARDDAGTLLMPQDSHVTIAHPNRWDGAMMLRRGFNYTDGADPLGKLDAGLFFMAYVRDPRVQYVPIQEEISRVDVMTVEYLRTLSSGLFAVPAGVAQGSTLGASGSFVGEALFS